MSVPATTVFESTSARVYELPYEDLRYPSDAVLEEKFASPAMGPALGGARILMLKRLPGSSKDVPVYKDLKFCRIKEKGEPIFFPCEHLLYVLGQPWIENNDASAVPGYVSALLAWDYDNKVREIGDTFVKNGDEVMGWLCLGGLHQKRKEWIELMSVCRRGIRKYPDVPDFYALLAQAYLAEGNRLKATEALDQGIERCDGAEGLKDFLKSIESDKS